MAQSEKALQTALIDGTCTIFAQDPGTISVNQVRKHVESARGLEDGFFTNGEWKQKSKDLIRDYVTKLHDGWKPGSNDIKQTSTKRQAAKMETSEPKRRKKFAVQAKKEELDLSDLSEIEAKPNMKAKPAKRAGKPSQTKSETREEESESKKGLVSHVKKTEFIEADNNKSFPSSPERTRKPKAEDGSDEESKLDEPIKSKGSSHIKKHEPSGSDSDLSTPDDKADLSEKPTVKDEEDTKTGADEEEEFSDIIDEPPKRARKKGKPDSDKKPVKRTTSSAVPEDSKEAEIKKLQSHLIKCGVRKLWHNELKIHGDDARAKIRHLKKMLADVGMDGRFSESKAREIKETRELMAEAEAAQEMNALWGLDTGGRASRSKTKKPMREKHSDDSEDDEDVKDEPDEEGEEKEEGQDGLEDDAEVETFVTRRRRARNDLAFLGEDDESESE